jgi:hypothetical protein
MRILIFGETAEAEQILEAKRAEGHQASLRNAEPGYFSSASPEPCDLAVMWDKDICHAYRQQDTEVEFLGETVTEETAAEYDAKPEEPKGKAERPVRRKKSKA